MAERDGAIAIVGMGCRVPGADNIRELWRVLSGAENHVVDIPPSRWNARAFYDADPVTPGKTYVTKAGLVSGCEEFDNKVYGISDVEAATMDPQQRFVLDCSLMAMEDAGWTRRQLAGSNTGVFLGVSNSDYRSLFRASSSNVGNYTVTGISNSIIAARVSYVFDLRGPSLVLDTACSSSLIGVHLACQAIRAGDCDMAIAGGTNYLTLPDVFVHLSKAGMMSRTGQCHAFGSQADGYARGEGCGIVLLKPLSHAERDGDNIWATIYTGTNQDGHTVSPLTAPSGVQQQCLLDTLYHKIGIDPDSIDYVEAHGTGTSAGDPVEANSVGNFFQRSSTTKRRYVGSIKTNIGHLESAAGVVGVIKILLMMKHSTIVQSLHCEEPNPNINFDQLMLVVPGKPVPWDTRDKLACCNSFGFGGSNCHAVLCQYQPQEEESSLVTISGTRRHCIVCLSAYTEKSLRGMMAEILNDPDVTQLRVHDLSYTSTARRDHYPLRQAWVVDDLTELLDTLQKEISSPAVPGGAHRKPKVTFVYCGMGTAWPGMCTELMDVLPAFRHAILQVEEHLMQYVQWSLSERLRDWSHLEDPAFSPIAIFATQVALTAVWRDLGLEPQSIVGQSVGEVAAAHAAGCVSLQDAVKIVFHRSRLLAGVTGGQMVVVRHLPVEQTRKVVDKFNGKACVSLQYSPTACCISADKDVMEEIEKDLLSHRKDNKGLQLTNLDVPVAYHSHHVQCCSAPLSDALQGLQALPPTVPLLSSVTGQLMTTGPDVDYWVDNLCCPVLFHQAVEQSRDTKAKQVFLEIGPKAVLRAHLPDLFPKDEVPCVASMTKPPEYRTFLQAVTQLYVHGANFTWTNLPTLGTKVTDLPRYVFDTKNSLAKTETAVLMLSGADERKMVHPYTFSLEDDNNFKLIVSPFRLQSVYHHILSGRVVVPGAFYVEAGFAMAKRLQSCRSRSVVVSANFKQAINVPRDGFLQFDVHLPEDLCRADILDIPINIVKDSKDLAQIHITEVQAEVARPEVINLDHVRSRCTEKANKEFIYNALYKAGFMYGESYCLLDDAVANSEECLAILRPTKLVMDEMAGTTIHPSVLDCMLQSALIIAAAKNGNSDRARDLLPKAVGGVAVHRPLEDTMMVYSQARERGAKQHVYDLKLLTPAGLVIAEVDRLVVNLITETDERSLPDMFSMEWSHVTPLPPPDSQPESKRVLYLCDGPVVEADGVSETQRVLSIEGVDFTQGLPASLQQTLSTAFRSAEAIVLLAMLQPLDENAKSERLTQHITSVSFLYKELLLLATQLSLSATIFLCTCNAWPFTSSDHALPINPASTGLWGVCRTVVTERLYPYVAAVDLALATGQLTMPNIEKIVDLMMTHPQLRYHPELLVTPEGIHINLVTIVDSNTPEPPFRTNMVKGDQPAVLLSREWSTLVKPVAVQHDFHSNSSKDGQNMTHIYAEAYGLQNPALFKMKMQYDRLSGPNQPKVYTVFSVEVEGLTHLPTAAKGRMATRVAACYPMAVATQVCVPTSATVKTNLLPGYQLGDLTKLIVLWELCNKITTQRVTLLASRRNHHYGTALQAILAGRKCGKATYTVNMVLAEDLGTLNSPLHDTVVSLVRLDSVAMGCLTSRWKNAVSLVTVCPLLDYEVMSSVYCFVPDLKVTVVDTQLLFQPQVLKTLVPMVAKWVKGHAKLVPKIMIALHEDTSEPATLDGGVVRDLADMLQMQRTEVTDVEVFVTKDQLFRQDGAYLVVGGLGGLGWLCVEYLAQKGAGHVAILNRRSPNQDHLTNIQGLKARHDCHVHAFQGDVTSLQSLNDVLEQMKAVFPAAQLKGIFFGGAATADKSFLNMDVPSFHKALNPKVQGVWNLHQLTKDLDLNYFVMHSSIASVVGNGGQSNYAAGNAFMDGLAHYRRQRGLAAQSINWGPLDTGILTDDDVTRGVLSAQGFLLMSPEEIQTGLTPLLMLNWAQCGPVKVLKDRLTERVQREGNALFMARLSRVLNIRAHAMEVDIVSEVQAAKNYDPEKRRAVYETYLRHLVASVLSVEISDITDDVNLMDMGMDSVGAMTLINQIHRDTSVRLPAVALLTGEPTVQSIVQAIEETPEGGDGEDGTSEGPTITEITEEVSIETTVLENHQLNLYKDSQDLSFHRVVDIPLKVSQAVEEDVRTAITTVMDKLSAAGTVLSLDSTSSQWYRRPSHNGLGHDLRVLEGDGSSVWESVDRDTCEPFDLTHGQPVRFLLMLQSKPVLRVVFLKAVFDLHSSLGLASELKQCLESVHSVYTISTLNETLDSLGVQGLNQSFERLYAEHHRDMLQHWEARLPHSVVPQCFLTFKRSQAPQGLGETKIGSVQLSVPPSLVSQLATFTSFHNLPLLGLLASCHQVLLHGLTRQQTVVLLCHKNLGTSISNSSQGSVTNNSSDIPLIANFTPDTATGGACLQNFVLNNTKRIVLDIKHGVLPLSMLQPVSQTATSLLASCLHGICSETLRHLDNGARREVDKSSTKKMNTKQALKLNTTEGTAAMTLGLHTNLMVEHLPKEDSLILTLSYREVVMDKVDARAMLRSLVHVLVKLLTRPNANVQQVARKTTKLTLKQAKP